MSTNLRPTDTQLAQLPERFLWGAATSGHQVEGDNRHSDWWAFERERLRHRSGAAADFLHRFQADLDAAAELGLGAFRFGIEWSRLEPRPGERAADGVAFYDALVDACRERGLEPIATLVHFTLPSWCHLDGRRGWLDEDVQRAFGRHVARVVERWGDRVTTWVTVNEPAIFAAAAYVAGIFPPGRRARFDLAGRVELALLRAHTTAYRTIHRVAARCHPGAETSVGVAKHVVRWQRADESFVSRQTRGLARRFNWRFVDAIATGRWRCMRPTPTTTRTAQRALGTLDWLGVNYYTSAPATPASMLRLGGLLERRAGDDGEAADVSEMGWPIEPEGLTDVLVEASQRYELPIIVTENGIADADDSVRGSFIASHAAAVCDAVARGADVRGYLYWSLLDNFEWHEGFWPRFGLLAVDYETQERTLRDSAFRYSQIIRRHARVRPETESARGAPKDSRHRTSADTSGGG